MMKQLAALAATALVAVSAPALAQAPNDAQIAHIAYTAGQIDVAAARQALQLSHNQAVRDFDGPMLGTCAGMIVLDRNHLGLIDLTVRRNAFGRQVASFETDLELPGESRPLRAVFIRAPWIEDAGPEVEVLAEVDGHPVLAREGRFLVAAFHPELTDDTRLHEMFLEEVACVRA